MGSQPTLDPAPTKPPDTSHQQYRDTRDGRDELLEHLQTPAAWGGHEFGDWPVDQIAGGFGGDLDARHRHDHTRLTHVFGHTHPERDAVREAEQTFDRLNPDYGVPADTHNPDGRQALWNRSGACAWRYSCVSQDGGAAIPQVEPEPRPSDYESDVRRRPGRLQTDRACSRWMPRRSRWLPTDPDRSSG
jgi:hypothetical protein